MVSKNGKVPVEAMKNGFMVVPFKLPKNKVSQGGDSNGVAYHYLFARKHESKIENEQNCIFMVNIPLLATVDNFKKVVNSICAEYNTVAYVDELLYSDEFGLQEVDLSSLTSDLMSTNDPQDKRYTPRNTVLLKFVDGSSLTNFWSSLKKYCRSSSFKIEWEYTSPSVGTFLNFYKPLDIEYLKEDIHSHMALFEQRELQAQEEVQSSIVDEDGFTLVVGKNTKSLNSIRKKILNKNPLSKHESISKPKSAIDKKAKQDFYRFQVRERKKQEINQLLSKFKEDQERIKEMKNKRKFNPYT